MAYQETLVRERGVDAAAGGPIMHRGPAFEAFWPLYVAFIAAPILAGLDKYLNLLTDWGRYASPSFAALFGGRVSVMMHTVGIVEILAGLIVAWKPRIGGLIVALWLAGIILNLLLIPGFYDIALRDFGLMLAAISLSRLSANHP